MPNINFGHLRFSPMTNSLGEQNLSHSLLNHQNPDLKTKIPNLILEMDQTFISLLNLCIKILAPSMMILQDEAFGRWWSPHKMNWVQLKKAQEPLIPSSMWSYSVKMVLHACQCLDLGPRSAQIYEQ